MPITPSTSQDNLTDEHKEKYFSFHVKGWTNFDPTGKTLCGIAEGIDQGDGFLNLVEVLKIENDLAGIGDEDVRECFANLLAAKRLIKTIRSLPKSIREEVQLALKTEDESVPQKPVASVANPGGAEPMPGKQWP